MTSAEVARLLIERQHGKVDPRVPVLFNRALLRIHSQPSLTSFLRDAGLVVREDGTHAMQFLFNRLPSEVVPSVERLLCASDFKSRWSQFALNGQAIMALELDVDFDELPDKYIDYAF